MADVHFFRDIWRRIVDDYMLSFADVWRLDSACDQVTHVVRHVITLNVHVDKARTGNFGARDDALEGGFASGRFCEILDNTSSHFVWRLDAVALGLQLLREFHCTVALVVAVLLLCCE